MRTVARSTRRRLAAGLAAALCAVVALATLAAADGPPAGSAAALVGPTEGFALALEASADLAGSLETCGCPKRPMGGYAWRTGYAAELDRATRGEVSILHVDAGRAFADDASGAVPDDVRIKNEWMLRSFDALGVAAANVAHADLAYLAPVMKRRGYAARARRFRALDRLVSTNLVATAPEMRPFKSSIVRTVSGGRLGARPLRIGFLGVTETPPAAVAGRLAASLAGYRVEDPVDAVRRELPGLRARSDVVVVLAYVDRDTARRIGALGPDAVVAAHQYPLFNKTDAAGSATVAYVTSQTKWLSELRFARDASRAAAVVAHRDVALDAATPSDPRAAELVDAARAAFTAAQKAALARESTGTAAATLEARRVALADASPFAGAESCATCHERQYAVWQSSRHAHAFRTLEAKNRQFDAACTVCHSVRQGEDGGFLDLRLTPRLENVQCESCHGPGKAHVRAPKDGGYGRVDLPARCVSCHSSDNDPDFDFSVYWPKVAHDDPEPTP